MPYSLAADTVLVVHLLFILFVALGGLLVWWLPKIAWLHVPAAIWGAMISFGGWVCPLTPWENQLRRAAGELGYESGFIEHYLLAAIYPEGLTRTMQIGIGITVVILNVSVYALLLRKRARTS